MAELGTALAIVLGVNLFLWLGQVAVLEMNPAGPVFYHCEGSMADEYGDCTTYVLDDTNIAGNLPSVSGDVQSDSQTGDVITDTSSATSGWFAEGTGLGYLYNIAAAPYNFLKALGTPAEFSFAVGSMWYAFTVFLIIAFIFGRDA